MVKAAAVSVGKLRPVLDYWSCETCLEQPTREQNYFCSVCRHLNREVVVNRGLGMSSNEAVRVISPDEFERAEEANRMASDQRSEIEALQSQLKALNEREDQLKSEVERLEAEAEELRREGGLVSLELVEVRRAPLPEEPEMEFTADDEEPPAFEPVEPEAPTEAPTEPPAPEFAPVEETPPAEPEPEIPLGEGEAVVRAPEVAAAATEVEQDIERIESEIKKIEEELALIAAQERDLKQRGAAVPRATAPKATITSKAPKSKKAAGRRKR